ncbi:MAG: GGDEF domain-containing protein [Thiohalomonadaceae bacterium]
MQRPRVMGAGARGILHWIVIVVLLAAVGIADAFAGPHFMLAILYLLPIGLAAWWVRRVPSIAVAVVSWSLALYNSGLFSAELGRHPGEVMLDAVTTLGFFVLTAVLLSRLREKQDLLMASLDTDPVTGAVSVRGFYRYANQELSRVRRYGRALTLAYLDLDNFKYVNDTHGHATGDRLLRVVAETLRDNTRAVDKVARLGGDEFAILFPETAGNEASQALIKVRDQLLARMRAERWPVTVSVGIVSCSECPDVDALLKEADELMYSVKRSGKNAIALKIVHGRDGVSPS